jgi:hypothetical protein
VTTVASEKQHTCMISRSWTYLRSVSTISLIILCRADSFAVIVVTVDIPSETRVSDEDDGTKLDMGEGGAGSKADSGSRSTMMVTVLMTYRVGIR